MKDISDKIAKVLERNKVRFLLDGNNPYIMDSTSFWGSPLKAKKVLNELVELFKKENAG